MNESHKREFATLIAALAETFGRDASSATQLGYWLGLKDLSLEDVTRAVTTAMRDSKRMPVPVELRDIALGGSAESRAIAAWTLFANAVSRVGGYRSVSFEDRTINAVVRSLGGWEYVCDLSVEEFDKWLRMNFLKAYEALAGKPIGDEAGAPLLGLTAKTNQRNGHYHGSQRLIAIGAGGEMRPVAIEGRARELPRLEAKAP